MNNLILLESLIGMYGGVEYLVEDLVALMEIGDDPNSRNTKKLQRLYQMYNTFKDNEKYIEPALEVMKKKLADRKAKEEAENDNTKEYKPLELSPKDEEDEKRGSIALGLRSRYRKMNQKLPGGKRTYYEKIVDILNRNHTKPEEVEAKLNTFADGAHYQTQSNRFGRNRDYGQKEQ